jgi:hypothetical protein
MNLYSAKVSTWVGLDWGASHYWVNINECDNTRYKTLYHNEGKNYTSEKSAVRDAVNWFRRERLTGCLLLGDAGRYEPTEVLVGPRALKAGANALNRRAEACGRWEGDEAEMKKISKEWDALWDAAIPPEKPKKTLKRRIS